MDILKQKAVEDLRAVREHLLSIKKDALTFGFINQWHTQWFNVFLRTRGLIGNVIEVRTRALLSGFDSVRDTEVLDELRSQIAEVLDQAMADIDKQVAVRPILDNLVLQVKDTKLATLLKEFNATKNATPNLAAIGFRTIMTLIIQERAKVVNPTSKLATKIDLGFEPDIKSAIADHIFSSGEEKLLHRYLTGGNKDIFDNVSHKPGANTLVQKDDLDDAVDLLNKLLPTII